MHLYRLSSCRYSTDLSGTGAAQFGGRWNSKGVYLLYTSSTSSLAILEILAHGIKLNEDYCLATLFIPDELVYELSEEDLPADWQVFPSPASTQYIGDNFIASNQFLALIVPSAVNVLEKNILINPNHSDFNKIKLVSVIKFGIDSRLKNQIFNK